MMKIKEPLSCNINPVRQILTKGLNNNNNRFIKDLKYHINKLVKTIGTLRKEKQELEKKINQFEKKIDLEWEESLKYIEEKIQDIEK